MPNAAVRPYRLRDGRFEADGGAEPDCVVRPVRERAGGSRELNRAKSLGDATRTSQQ
ncbi:hypothetical protein GCM10010211_74010 [Streptomyces albospinus]|uniref:Uncharacterized protein n=1 Tax=Streptomyces albospinus TaxID=285515 RepID=A0ABQ2VPW3_9ACTN|nr:hypothetical protein GCM10010211_74010 [Streptomyces albospinus]